MDMKTGKCYTIDNSDLYWMVNKVYYSNGDYYKAKITLYYKKGMYKGYICEDRKQYKVYKNRIGHWYEYY